MEDRWDATVTERLSEQRNGITSYASDLSDDEQRHHRKNRNICREQSILEKNNREEGWSSEVQRSLEEERNRLHALNEKRSATARSMWAIVKAERALLAREMREKTLEKNKFQEPQTKFVQSTDVSSGVAAQIGG